MTKKLLITVSEHFKDQNEESLTKIRFKILLKYADPKLCHLFGCAALKFSGVCTHSNAILILNLSVIGSQGLFT